MHLSRDFKEFVASLNANNVRYLIAGGYAVAAHGHPRYTKDLDMWVAASADNARHLLKALADFGLAEIKLSEKDFTTPNRVIQLGDPPHRIDLLTTLDGVEFSACYASRIVLTLDGVPVNFIDLENLKRNKRATGRHQDLADVENLP
ncbi:MAG: hypothetical protein ACRETN_02550 [Nevskiales bacterium]